MWALCEPTWSCCTRLCVPGWLLYPGAALTHTEGTNLHVRKYPERACAVPALNWFFFLQNNLLHLQHREIHVYVNTDRLKWFKCVLKLYLSCFLSYSLVRSWSNIAQCELWPSFLSSNDTEENSRNRSPGTSMEHRLWIIKSHTHVFISVIKS